MNYGGKVAALCVFLIGVAVPARAATIDIMLVYDTTASQWVEQKGGMESFSLDAVNRMNLSAQNSDLDLEFRLAHSVSVNYTHADLRTDLEAVTGGTGAFAEVHTLRDDYGADLVALLVDTGSPSGTVGVGWVLGSYSGQPDYAFTSNSIQAVEISHCLVHEVGHNLGADHSKFQAQDPGPNPYLDGQYSAGWYFTGTNDTDYHTIMAYGDKDGDWIPPFHVPAPLFSTPLVQYQGTNAGNAQDGDNARLIRNTMDSVAAYRSAAGSLEVTIKPAEAVISGARWRRTGTSTWWSSADAETGIPAGSYSVEFRQVAGWQTPDDQSVTILADQTCAAEGVYLSSSADSGAAAMPWIDLLLLDD